MQQIAGGHPLTRCWMLDTGALDGITVLCQPLVKGISMEFYINFGPWHHHVTYRAGECFEPPMQGRT